MANKKKFNIEQLIHSLNPNYKMDIHRLNNNKNKNMNDGHYVICVHNFLSAEASTLYQTKTRKLCEPDLMRHGYRRHALYFDVNDSLKKRAYRYGKRDWPMNNGIPNLIQSELMNKIETEFGIALNGVVFNVYSSKHSQIWWHTDLQPGIADIVCTFSTGRTQKLDFRLMNKPVLRGSDKHKSEEKEQMNEKEQECVLSVDCHHGTLVIMTQGVNEYYQHRVDKPTKHELSQAMEKYGCIDRENTTMHFHFDQSKYDKYLNLNMKGGLAHILSELK